MADSFPYIGFYVKGRGGKFTDGLTNKQIKVLLDRGLIVTTNDPFRYLVHRDYFLEDVIETLEEFEADRSN